LVFFLKKKINVKQNFEKKNRIFFMNEQGMANMLYQH
jgi:hypothetical protein